MSEPQTPPRPPQQPGYPQQYPPQQPYPSQPGYPPQQAYPSQPPGYPTQQFYAPQGYGPQGYPPQGYAPQGYRPVAAPKKNPAMLLGIIGGILAVLAVVGVVLAMTLGKPGDRPILPAPTSAPTSAPTNAATIAPEPSSEPTRPASPAPSQPPKPTGEVVELGLGMKFHVPDGWTVGEVDKNKMFVSLEAPDGSILQLTAVDGFLGHTEEAINSSVKYFSEKLTGSRIFPARKAATDESFEVYTGIVQGQVTSGQNTINITVSMVALANTTSKVGYTSILLAEDSKHRSAAVGADKVAADLAATIPK